MNIEDISPRIYDERQLKAITGLSVEQFCTIVPIFDRFIIEEKENNKEDKVKPNNGSAGIPALIYVKLLIYKQLR